MDRCEGVACDGQGGHVHMCGHRDRDWPSVHVCVCGWVHACMCMYVCVRVRVRVRACVRVCVCLRACTKASPITEAIEKVSQTCRQSSFTQHYSAAGALFGMHH
jgi:hypothetical protein